MDVKQIYAIVNGVSVEVLGKGDIVQEDLRGIVDLGTEIFNANAVDNYVKTLVNHIGKVIFVNRPYTGNAPSVLMDAWEFGSVLEKVSAELPDATENETWSLTDGEEYKQDVFYKPKVSTKFFNSKVTFEVPISITERQVKESFSNAEQLNAFISMIYNAVDTAMTVKADALIMRTINNMISQTLENEKSNFTGGDLATGSSLKAVNLLKLYNDGATTPLTVANALKNADFLRFASYMLGVYVDRLKNISVAFNIGGKARFTPNDRLKIVLLSDFAKAANVYLYSDTFNKSEVTLPQAETVAFWQGSGKKFEFDDVSKISVKDSANKTYNVSGILAVMFDREALGVSNLDRRVTSNYNAKAEFFNNYFKFDAGYFNDTNENFVVFFIA